MLIHDLQAHLKLLSEKLEELQLSISMNIMTLTEVNLVTRITLSEIITETALNTDETVRYRYEFIKHTQPGNRKFFFFASCLLYLIVNI